MRPPWPFAAGWPCRQLQGLGLLLPRQRQGRLAPAIAAGLFILLLFSGRETQPLNSPGEVTGGVVPKSSSGGAALSRSGRRTAAATSKAALAGTATASSCPRLEAAPEGCLEVRHVCLDQGQAVLYGREYQPSTEGAARVPLPTWSPPVVGVYPFLTGDGSNPDVVGAAMPDLPPPLPPLRFRPVSASEPTADLASPEWSCQVPLILQTAYLENYAHTLANTGSWLFGYLVAAQDAAQLAQRALVAIATPWNLGLAPWARALLQPMSPHPVTTLADLSSRGGNHSRCFASALLCERHEVWDTWRVWQTAQHSLRYWQPTWSVLQPNMSWHNLNTANTTGSASGAHKDSAGGKAPAMSQQSGGRQQQVQQGKEQEQQHQQQQGGQRVRTWRVLFQQRREAVRQFTNLAQLLDSCSAWQYLDTATGWVHRAECGVWWPVPPVEAMAVAQAADIVVGTHGANTANALFMRPGTSLIEIFCSAFNHQFVQHWLELDPQDQVHWWGVVVEDWQLYSPSAHEQQQRQQGIMPYRGDLKWMMRDRNLELPWDVLRGIMDCIAALNGSTPAYRQVAASGRHVTTIPAPNGRKYGLQRWLERTELKAERLWHRLKAALKRVFG